MTNFYKGSVTLLALIFGGIFLGVLTALAGYVLAINTAQDAAYNHAQALALAETGLAAYQLQIAADPSDVSPHFGTTEYHNFEGSVVGTYRVSVTPEVACGQTIGYAIASRGVANVAPDAPVTIAMRYAAPLDSNALAALKIVAQSSGLYLAPSGEGNTGYHLALASDGSAAVSTEAAGGGESPLGTYPLNASCALIYAEDNLALDGSLDMDLAVVSAAASTTDATPTVQFRAPLEYMSGSTLTLVSGSTTATSTLTDWQIQ